MNVTRGEFLKRAMAAGLLPGAFAGASGCRMAGAAAAPYSGTDGGAWWKGNLHSHTRRSDGNAFPIEAAALYKRAGYHFFALTDHDVSQEDTALAPNLKYSRMRPDFLVPVQEVTSAERYELFTTHFPDLEIPTETSPDGVSCFRYQKFDEMARILDEPGRFLLISGTEMDCAAAGDNFHANVLNTRGNGPTVRTAATESDAWDLLYARYLEIAGGGPHESIFTLNHPYWVWRDVSPQVAIDRPAIRFFEICNSGGDAVVPLPEGTPPIDRWWDAVNTARALRGQPLLYGMGSDDIHNYRSFYTGEPDQRSYCVVRARALTCPDLFEAFYRGDFYASTGVTLADVRFDPETRALTVKAEPLPGKTLVFRFVGSRRGVRPDPVSIVEAPASSALLKVAWGEAKALWFGGKRRRIEQYDPRLGETFQETEGTEATYRMRPDDLYVRCKVFVKNGRGLEDSTPPRVPTAWTQPCQALRSMH